MNIDWNKERRRVRDQEIRDAVTAGVNEALSDVADRLSDHLSSSLAFSLGTDYRHALRGVRNAIRAAVDGRDSKPQTADSRPVGAPADTDTGECMNRRCMRLHGPSGRHEMIGGPHCGESACTRDHTAMGRCI
jgi:hypothetical protein